MQHIDFKKTYCQGLYSFLHISRPYAIKAFPEKGDESVLYKHQFYSYIALAEYLTTHLEKFVVLRYSPYLSTAPFASDSKNTNWAYVLLASDEHGFADTGYRPAKELFAPANQLLALKSLLPLTVLPEDTFGDRNFTLSIFGVFGHRVHELENMLRSDALPDLSHFLLKGELFMHVVINKESGLFNGLLVKSTTDIEEILYSFQTVIDPDN